MSMMDNSGFGVVDSSVFSDVNLIQMFMSAGLVVKIVVLCLLLASILSWSVIFDKLFMLSNQKRHIHLLEEMFNKSSDLESLSRKIGSGRDRAYAAVLHTAISDLTYYKDADNIPLDFISNDLRVGMNHVAAKVIKNLEKRVSLLATVASVSPFVGLFGTVWGIMNSFTSIANAKNTSLAIVAPGIAEALMVTAIGLLTAIPAVIFYNKFVNEINAISNQVDCFIDRVSVALIRNNRR